MNHSLSAREIDLFPIRPIPRKRNHLVSTRSLTIAFWLGLALLIGLAVNVFHLTPERIGVETVQAAEVEEVHQNDYYCNEIKEKGDHLLIERSNDINELCKQWGA